MDSAGSSSSDVEITTDQLSISLKNLTFDDHKRIIDANHEQLRLNNQLQISLFNLKNIAMNIRKRRFQLLSDLEILNGLNDRQLYTYSSLINTIDQMKNESSSCQLNLINAREMMKKYRFFRTKMFNIKQLPIELEVNKAIDQFSEEIDEYNSVIALAEDYVIPKFENFLSMLNLIFL